MYKKLSLSILMASLVVACNSDSEDDGNPEAKSSVINLTTSRTGTSGDIIDVNGDGKLDLIVGAPEAKPTSSKSGAALIYLDYQNNPANDISTYLSGEGEGDYYGFSFANLGDVNGDDVADFAVGAINAEGQAGISGAAYVYQGGENPPKLLTKLNGENAFDKFGFALAGGDVNGDGVNDVIVTAPYTFHEEFQAGAVYVYFGGTGLNDTPDVIIQGDKVNASVGMAVATGDVNGDGVADIIMDGHAKVYIYYGGTDLKTRIEADPTPNVNIRSDSGRHGGSGFGYSLAYAGDMDGDGFGDIVVGNPRRSAPSIYDNAGSLYVFKGGDDLPAEYFEDNADYRLVKVVGASVDDKFASSIKVVPDVDGNGKADIIVGAKWADGGSDGEALITGNVYLFHGEDMMVEDSSVELTVANAAMAFPQEVHSAEYGAFVASDDHSVFAGAPGANKHDGGVELKDLHSGSDVKIAENTHAPGGEADPHAGHH